MTAALYEMFKLVYSYHHWVKMAYEAGENPRKQQGPILEYNVLDAVQKAGTICR